MTYRSNSKATLIENKHVGIPDSPACDANGLHHMDTELTNIDEEKHKEAERAVTPADR